VRVADEIALRPVAPGVDGAVRSEVIIGGCPTGSVITGVVLEAAVHCAPGWLLFVTDDIPYEEMLTIHLLDPDGRPLDSAGIGGPYTTGTFSSMRLDPPSTVRFRFIDDADWFVEILGRPKRALPWWPDARGVRRSARIARHFVVGRQPR
jgi:hypothetical protein